MAAGDRIIIGVKPGVFYEQPGTEWMSTESGFDAGRMTWETHPNTPVSSYPKRRQVSAAYPMMFIVDCPHRHDASGMVVIAASFLGILNLSGGGPRWKEKVSCDTDLSMFTLPAKQGDGSKASIVAPVPKPKCTREYLTDVQPTNDGVSLTAIGSFLPDLPSFSISFVPDPDQPATLNYRTGWILENRSWVPVCDGVPLWSVRESFGYYFPLST